MRIITAIDIIDGKCVRLTKGNYSTQVTYSDNPLEMAKMFEDNGIEYLHLVDLDGAKSQHIVNHKVLYDIANGTSLKIDFGGGIKSDEDARIAFDNGATQITGGSVAVEQPELFMQWLQRYGAERVILGADSNNRMVATHGWLRESEVDVIDFILEYEQRGVKYVICTDIAKDGMLQGASEDLYREIISKSDVHLIASGGVASVDDLTRLKEMGCEGAIVGKAIYEGRISMDDLKPFLGL